MSEGRPGVLVKFEQEIPSSRRIGLHNVSQQDDSQQDEVVLREEHDISTSVKEGGLGRELAHRVVREVAKDKVNQGERSLPSQPIIKQVGDLLELKLLSEQGMQASVPEGDRSIFIGLLGVALCRGDVRHDQVIHGRQMQRIRGPLGE